MLEAILVTTAEIVPIGVSSGYTSNFATIRGDTHSPADCRTTGDRANVDRSSKRLDLSRLDLSRVAANNPLLETNCY